jgi:hypothetical protein
MLATLCNRPVYIHNLHSVAMDDFAKNVVGLSTNLKSMRDEFTPLKKRIIDEMTSANIDEFAVGNHVLKLESKRSRKSVGMKKILNIIQVQFGVEALATFKGAVEEAKGEAVVKHSLKIVDA